MLREFSQRQPEGKGKRIVLRFLASPVEIQGAEVALGVLAKMRRSAEGVARAYVDLFLETVWEPFDRAGRPEEDWPKVRDALERLRPLASEALLAVFQNVMSEATERALERTVQSNARYGSRPKRSRRRRR